MFTAAAEQSRGFNAEVANLDRARRSAIMHAPAASSYLWHAAQRARAFSTRPSMVHVVYGFSAASLSALIFFLSCRSTSQ